jgi:hypothetical protein
VAALLAVFMFSHGAANAALEKADQKCVNSINKGAAKVAATQGKENAACIKNGGKGKLTTPTVEECLTDDPKNKVSGAIGKIKVGDCGSPPAFPAIDTDKNSIGAKMVNAELDLIHAVFGTDLDAVVVVSNKTIPGTKDSAKCQAAVAKAIGKCLDTKFKEYNACKKNKLKGKDTTAAEGADELRTQCMEDGTTGAIPDGKGKIAKKCVTAIGDTLSKKCAVPNVGDLITGCDPVTKECIDQKVECEVCRALRELDGLFPNCDLFDNGVEDGSCDPLIGEIGQAYCDFDERAFCMGGSEDGQPCTDPTYHTDCPGAKCIGVGRAFLATHNPHSPDSNDPAYADVNPTLRFGLNGGLDLSCGSIDPNTGKAPCTCALAVPISLPIPPITQACLTPMDPNFCHPGEIDCDGGSGQNVYMLSDHDIAEDVLGQGDPPFGPFGYYCGSTNWPDDPNSDANETCAAMCDYYCTNLPGNYTRFLSGCEGYCRGGVNEGEVCQFSLASQGSPHCQGPTADESGFCVGSSRHRAEDKHPNTCNCNCLEVGGPPSPPGALYCQIAIRTVEILPEENCLEAAPDVLQGQQCLPYTTEYISSTILDPDRFYGHMPIIQTDIGNRKSCEDIKANNLSGFVKVSNVPGFDGQLGDSPVEVRAACVGADFGEPFARPPE